MKAFTVLLPVYRGDQPAHFERALTSIGADQTLQAQEILIVRDGPVHPKIDELLMQCEAGKRPDIHGKSTVTVLRLPTNQGLSAALNAGLAAAQHPIVARADADDISIPTRFERQIPLMDRYQLLGSAIVEFSDDENSTGMLRSMPTNANDIARTIAYRDPFNHPTVVYHRQAVLDAGGYQHLDLMEDYWLFARMVVHGVTCANLPEPLVKYRIGAGAYDRRGGMRLLRSELTMQRYLRHAGITTPVQYVRNVLIRGTYRLIPGKLRQTLYQTVGKRRWFANSGASTP